MTAKLVGLVGSPGGLDDVRQRAGRAGGAGQSLVVHAAGDFLDRQRRGDVLQDDDDTAGVPDAAGGV